MRLYTVTTQCDMRENVVRVIITRTPTRTFNKIEVLYLIVQYLRRTLNQ